MGWVANASPEVEAASQYEKLLSVCIVFSVMSTVIVGMRLWARYVGPRLAADDILVILSQIFALAYSAICIVQTRYGLGLPLVLRPPENLLMYTKVNYAGRPIYQLGISFFKIALLLSYLRLFQGTNHRISRIVVWTSIVAIFLSHLACAFSLIFACSPVQKSWKPLMDGTCLPPGPSFTVYAVVTIVSDVVVALIPIPVLLKLNVPRSKKIGLVGIFLLGLFTTLCSVFRYLEIDRIQNGDKNSTMLILWGVIEFNVGNMVSSLPFLAPVFLKKAREYRHRYYNDGYGSQVRGPGNSHNPMESGHNSTHISASRRRGSNTLALGGSGSMKAHHRDEHGFQGYGVSATELSDLEESSTRGDSIHDGSPHNRASNSHSTVDTPDDTASTSAMTHGLSNNSPHGNPDHDPGNAGIVRSIAYSVRVEPDDAPLSGAAFTSPGHKVGEAV